MLPLLHKYFSIRLFVYYNSSTFRSEFQAAATATIAIAQK